MKYINVLEKLYGQRFSHALLVLRLRHDGSLKETHKLLMDQYHKPCSVIYRRIKMSKRKMILTACMVIILGMNLLAGCGQGEDFDGENRTLESREMDTDRQTADNQDQSSQGQDVQGQSSQKQDGERIRVTLGTVWGGNWELDNAVEAYNARNGKYYVEVVDYFPEDFEGVANDVYDAALDRLRMDLATGKGQDIIEFQYGFVPDELGYAGVLADLNTFISPVEREETYLSNILDCAQTGGSLYEIAPVFGVSGIIGDGSKLGMETGWTMEEMLAVFKKYGKDANAWGSRGVYTAETLVEHAIEDFVDWETGEADFCKQEFYDILEFAKNESGFVRVTRESVSSGIHLICAGGADVTDTQRMDWLFGDNAVMKGWPCSQGTGISVSFDISSVRLGISAYSQCKEGAWDFIQYYVGLDWMEEWVSLHPDYPGSQTPASLPGLPINRKRFEEVLEQSMIQQYFEDTGKPIPLRQGDPDQRIPDYYANTKEHVERLLQIVAMADRRELPGGSVIRQIIGEEISGYKAGVLTAEQTAQKIQNRVQLYLDEHKQK